jgi:hypothetical protein
MVDPLLAEAAGVAEEVVVWLEDLGAAVRWMRIGGGCPAFVQVISQPPPSAGFRLAGSAVPEAATARLAMA